MYDCMIKNGTIVSAEGMFDADIAVKNGKIAAIGKKLCGNAKHNIDASGKLIFPGAVDAHFHIGEYHADFEDMRTSTMAAAAGGVTTAVDMPLNLYTPSVLTKEAVQLKDRLLDQESYIDYVMWGGLTPDSISKVIDFERRKVRSLKLDGRQAFMDSRPLSAELIATQTIITLLKETKCRGHICHVSHPEVAKLIEHAQMEGIDITAETCPHYLTFCTSDYFEKGCQYGCAPPLKDEKSREGLWEYVKKGVLSCIASDYSPGMPENRSDVGRATYETGFGISGVQTMFQVIYDQGVNKRNVDPCLIASALSTNPAKRWGLYGSKGDIKPGFDADFVIFNPEKPWTINQNELFYKVKLTAFHGLTGKGAVEHTFIRGQEVFCEGKILVDHGFGKRVL